MLEKFVQRNVIEVDGLIARAKERLMQHESEMATKRDPAESQDIAVRMRQGLARLQVYRSFIEKMN